MLRSIFISLSKISWAQRAISKGKFAWKLASRFIAGENKDSALRVVAELNSQGLLATLDYLGEHAQTIDAAKGAVNKVLVLLDDIQSAGLKANVSIKLTQLGLILDEEFCFNHLLTILAKAQENDNFIRIDMEDSSLTEKTLEFLHQVMVRGYSNVGIVIQSYLYRSEKDTRALAASRVPVRVVKGAYRESEQVAYPDKGDVDRNFDLLTSILLEAALQEDTPLHSHNGRFPPLPAIATHEVKRILFAREKAKQLNLTPDRYEFQMLFGIRRNLQHELVKAGYFVRVYVPYGTHWYPYFMRRLAERPANVWFIIDNLFRP